MEKMVSETEKTASCSSDDPKDSGDFECNICFELAQDPIVTLCGHLYCWPCLHRWLHLHSRSQECPVCKAVVQEEKLVPLFGRGKPPTDPRSKPVPGFEIPSRPAGQRPETAAPPEPNVFPGFGFAVSAGLGGWLPHLLNVQFGGFPAARLYVSTAAGYDPYGFSGASSRGGGVGAEQVIREEEAKSNLSLLLLLIGLFVICWLLF